jgi:outer membrane receptor protein involved in Fe transport
MGSLRYEFTKGLNLMVRTSIDRSFDNIEAKLQNDTYQIADYGNYLLIRHNALEINNEILLNYNSLFGDKVSLDVSFGGNMSYQKNEGLITRTEDLLKPNLFTITNTGRVLSEQRGLEKQINSLYGFATIGFKDILFLDFTGRNDWSSTLPKESWSYFYPSVGLTWLIVDMINSVPSFLTLAKVRANYAEVGNDTDAYRINKKYTFGAGGILGYAWRGGTLPVEDLKPENTKSTEIGFDLRFFQNRLGIDFTLYRSNTFNQLLSIPLPQASGYTSKLINAGNVQNQGMEITLNATPVHIRDFSWF